MRAPEFWSTDNGLARLLEPVGQIVGAVTARKLARAKPVRVAAPVICVGNLTAGGTGKTPVAASLAALLRARGKTPAIVLRGYGGRLRGPVRIASGHTVEDVGDEALLHARATPTWVARRRDLGAAAAVTNGADVIVLDDGHQNGDLTKDLSLVVVDGMAGFGNGRLIPAGPLREPVAVGLARADAIIVMGDDPRDLAGKLGRFAPVLRARLVPGPEHQALANRRVVAFAGLGDPEKFFRSLSAAGARVVARHPFDDHYAFTGADIQPILDEAFALDAIPVTTEKDAIRLPADQRQQVNVVPVTLGWEDETAIGRLIDEALNTKR
jgi:tetraacyldisaccharide 4'-kinase